MKKFLILCFINFNNMNTRLRCRIGIGNAMVDAIISTTKEQIEKNNVIIRRLNESY